MVYICSCRKTTKSETIMAGKCRIKVSCGDVEPCWMFVDCRECPKIVNLHHRIEELFHLPSISSLILDGCLLPPNETTELLHDNDVVHVRVTHTEHVSKSAPSLIDSATKIRKRKHADDSDDLEKTEFENHGQSEGTVTLTNNFVGSESETERKKKHKRSKDKSCKEDTTAGDASLLAETVSAEEDHQKTKKKKKKTKEKESEERSCDTSHTEAPAELLTASVVGHATVSDKQETPHSPAVASTSNPEEGAVPKPRRRRRHKKKRAGSPVQTEPCQVPAPAVDSSGAVRLQLPKWKQPKSKKTVFSSDEEQSSTPTHDDQHSRAEDKGREGTGGAGDADRHGGQASPACTQYSSRSTPSKAGGGHTKGSSPTGRAEVDNSRLLPVSSGVNGLSKVNGVSGALNSKRAVNITGADVSSICQPYQPRETKEQRPANTWITQSPSNQHIVPMQHFTDQHQSNIAEHLKMSPEDRGVQVPPYMTAKRLANGAMLYKRNPLMFSAEDSNSQQQQLNAHQRQHNTPPFHQSLAHSQPPTAKGDGVTGNSKSTKVMNGRDQKESESQETIVLTPIYREYSLFPDLTAAPKIGDHIAYKVLEMGENYAPGISDFKEAEVLEYDASSQCVTVKVLPMNSAAGKKTPGKFDLEGEECDEEDVVTVELSAMFEPKLISS